MDTNNLNIFFVENEMFLCNKWMFGQLEYTGTTLTTLFTLFVFWTIEG